MGTCIPNISHIPCSHVMIMYFHVQFVQSEKSCDVFRTQWSSILLILPADDFGQRALVGKVCMDRNNAVKHYKETIQESQDETCRWVYATLLYCGRAVQIHVSAQAVKVTTASEKTQMFRNRIYLRAMTLVRQNLVLLRFCFHFLFLVLMFDT